MNTTTLILVNVLILGVVLEGDLGRRKVSTLRILRPLLSIPAALLLVHLHLVGSGHGLAFEVALLASGIVLGAIASAFMDVHYDATLQRVVTRAGVAYAAIWVFVFGARTLFSYGASHWWQPQVARFLVDNQITVNAFTAGIVVMAIAMALTRVLILMARSGRARSARKPELIASAA